MRYSLAKLIFILWASNCAANQTTINLSQSLQIQHFIKQIKAIACDNQNINCIAAGIEPKDFALVAYTTHDGGINWSNPIHFSSATSQPIKLEKHTSVTVNCDASAMNCMVAQLGIVDKIPRPIIYTTQDGGLSWSNPTLLPVPLTSQERKILSRANNELFASNLKLSCGSSLNCTLIGSVYSKNVMLPFIYSTQNWGQNWALAKTLEEPSHSAPSDGFHGTFLTDLSCDQTGKNCKAVGYTMARNSITNSFYAALPIVYISTNSGKKWNDPIILPTKMDFNHIDALTAVSCDASGKSCTTVGFTYHTDTMRSQLYSFSTQDSGRTWNKKVLIPSTEFSETASSLTCNSEADRCIAVGYYHGYEAGFNILKPAYYVSSNHSKNWEKFAVTFAKPTLFEDIHCDTLLTSCIVVGSSFSSDISKSISATTPIHYLNARL